MQLYTTYKVKIKHYNHIFKDTVVVYRRAVDYLIDVCISEWNTISEIEGNLNQQRYVEKMIHATKENPFPKYEFDKRFYKMPCYLRRGAISEAIGKVSSYKSNLKGWLKNKNGNKPSLPRAGFVFPSMYRTVMYNQTDYYEAQIKVYQRKYENTAIA